MEYVKYNAKVWDNINDSLTDWTTMLSHEGFVQAQAGQLNVSLTGVKHVPREWFPPLKGCKILALACGGGQQCPVFAAHGAMVTVTDVSEGQLEKERQVALRESYSIHVVKADMAQPLPFEDGTFEMIFNPVSNCYIEEILPLWSECARVLQPGGVLMTGFVKEEHFLFEPDFAREDFLLARHRLPFNPLRDLTEEQLRKKQEARLPLAFSHSLTEQLGGLLRAGFALTDLYEDGDGGGLFDKYMNSYVAVRAVKK